MSGHFDDDQVVAQPPLSPSAFRQQREAAGIRDSHSSLALAYAFSCAEAASAPQPPKLIQIGPLDV